MDCSPPDSSAHRTFQARMLEWVAISYSRAPSRLVAWRDVLRKVWEGPKHSAWRFARCIPLPAQRCINWTANRGGSLGLWCLGFSVGFYYTCLIFFFRNQAAEAFTCLLIFGCTGSSLLRTGFLWLQLSGATLGCAAWASHCGGFSCCRAWTPERAGFSSCGTQA